MDYKVHWIIDGIMNVDANSKEDAEKIVQLQNFVKNSDDLMNFFIAKSIQGQAYLPPNEENDIIQKGMTPLFLKKMKVIKMIPNY